jgi:hypothetical protein
MISEGDGGRDNTPSSRQRRIIATAHHQRIAVKVSGSHSPVLQHGGGARGTRRRRGLLGLGRLLGTFLLVSLELLHQLGKAGRQWFLDGVIFRPQTAANG